MADIAWGETKIYQPQGYSITEFCAKNHIHADARQFPDGPLVFIERSALEGLHDFLAHDVQREHGGVLVGVPYWDARQSRYFSDIRVALPAHESEGNPVHFRLTPESWEIISGIIEESHPDYLIVGWYHSHPGLGVFMSGTDRATQAAFYAQDWKFAVVVDPVARKSGWFSGSACVPIDPGQVIAYQKPESIPTEELEEAGRWQAGKPSLEKMRWLLPFAGMMLAVCLAGLWFWRRRV